VQVNPASAQQVEGSQLWALSTGNEGGPAVQGAGGGAGDTAGSSSGGDQVCAAMPAIPRNLVPYS
jgi:hypothetical protein